MPNHIDTIDLLANQALWYAWGQADAGTTVDAFAFSAHYRALAARPQGRPSIQDAFRAFTACVVIPGVDGPTCWDCGCPECKALCDAERAHEAGDWAC